MVPELVVTRRELLAEATRLLRAAEVAEPRREAGCIWAWLDREPVATVRPDDGAAIAPARMEGFLPAVRRCAAGEPLAQVTGWAGFRGGVSLAVRPSKYGLALPKAED